MGDYRESIHASLFSVFSVPDQSELVVKNPRISHFFRLHRHFIVIIL